MQKIVISLLIFELSSLWRKLSWRLWVPSTLYHANSTSLLHFFNSRHELSFSVLPLILFVDYRSINLASKHFLNLPSNWLFVYFQKGYGQKMVVKTATSWISLFAVSSLVFCLAAGDKSTQASSSKVASLFVSFLW